MPAESTVLIGTARQTGATITLVIAVNGGGFFEHPLEAAWGGVVLTAPLFLWPVWGPGYVAFPAVVGIHEVLDHAGVRLDVPLLSPSRDHDRHHRSSRCFYGQLLPWLDRVSRRGLGSSHAGKGRRITFCPLRRSTRGPGPPSAATRPRLRGPLR